MLIELESVATAKDTPVFSNFPVASIELPEPSQAALRAARARSRPLRASALLRAPVSPDRARLDPRSIRAIDPRSIRARDARLAHPLHLVFVSSGARVASYPRVEIVAETGSEAVKAGVAASKFAKQPGFGEKIAGHLMLTYHQDDCWYRNIKIRELK